ncbi:hypothetical protein N7495_003770, partial [Penicillium taxi]|uniref:uncharacterized protein n=1 Tax=Penicillium taxi TaxID=168475 RepID=UPI0025450230
VLQIHGSDGRFSYELESKDDRQSSDPVETVHICDKDATRISYIKTIADYGLDLLDALEKATIIDSKDTGYQKQKKLIRGMHGGSV